MLKLGRYGTHNTRVVRLTGASMKTVSENGKPVEKMIYDGYLMPKSNPTADAGENGQWEENVAVGRIAKYVTPHVNKTHAFDLVELIQDEGVPVIPTCTNCLALQEENVRLKNALQEAVAPAKLRKKSSPSEPAAVPGYPAMHPGAPVTHETTELGHTPPPE